MREAQSAAALPHPNVVAIYDVGEAAGATYIAMELVKVLDLVAVDERAGPRSRCDACARKERSALRLPHDIDCAEGALRNSPSAQLRSVRTKRNPRVGNFDFLGLFVLCPPGSSFALEYVIMENRSEIVIVDSLTELLDASRSALLDIVSGAAAAWGKAELAAWLSGPYREATRRAPESVRRPTALAPYMQTARAAVAKDDRIYDVIAQAREQVLANMSEAGTGSWGFALDVLEAGDIEQVQDANGHFAFVPVDHARMTLCERMRSLLAADYLSRSSDYESHLTFCRSCDAVSFGAEARERGQCSSHSVSGSGIQLKPEPSTKRPTLMGLGRGSDMAEAS